MSFLSADPNVLLKPKGARFRSKGKNQPHTPAPTHTRAPLSAVLSPADDCFLDQDQGQGGCRSYTMMWFFDTERNECARFWYSGCGGNNNRFETQEECEDLCLTKSR